jgi:hypothetical protein
LGLGTQGHASLLLPESQSRIFVHWKKFVKRSSSSSSWVLWVATRIDVLGVPFVDFKLTEESLLSAQICPTGLLEDCFRTTQ